MGIPLDILLTTMGNMQNSDPGCSLLHDFFQHHKPRKTIEQSLQNCETKYSLLPYVALSGFLSKQQKSLKTEGQPEGQWEDQNIKLLYNQDLGKLNGSR